MRNCASETADCPTRNKRIAGTEEKLEKPEGESFAASPFRRAPPTAAYDYWWNIN